jgi:tetratricopeptide (TPR) repeat protein
MRNYKLIISLLLTFIFFFPAQSSQKNTLNQLFKKLSTIDNYRDADLLEKKIWAVWNKHPENKKLTDKLKFGTELMYEGNYNYALKVFNNIIKTDSEWSEAWNKRATLLFIMKDFNKSLEDIEIVLKIEPRHFGALSGQAQIYIKLREYEKALDSLKKAGKINPINRGNTLIPDLEKLIKEQSI